MGSSHEQEFRSALTPRYVRSLRLIALALGGGVLMLLLIAVALTYSGLLPEPEHEPSNAGHVLYLFSIMNAVLVIVTFGLASAAPRFLWARMPARRRADTGRRALDAVRAVFIVRLALCEAGALFGVIVCIVGATLGVLRTHPLYWLNAAAALVLLATIAFGFPDEDRLVALYESLIEERV
jgi:hypothetical protein